MADILRNIEKVLFAEDLVVYVMLCYNNPLEFTKTADCYRNVVYNAFNETVCAAVDFLISHCFKSNLYKFHTLRVAGMADEEHYKLLVNDLHSKCFSRGFEARKFLHFCAQLTSMAGIFCFFGNHEVPKIAAHEIARSLEDYPMHTGAWGTVNVIAAEYSKIAVTSKCNFYKMGCIVHEYKEVRYPPCASPESMLYAVGEAIEVNGVHEGDIRDDYHHERTDENVVVNVVTLQDIENYYEEWKDQIVPQLSEDVNLPNNQQRM